MYPSGGDERDERGFHFQSGFEKILTHCLADDDMVYAFYVDSEHASQHIKDKGRMYGAASAVITDDFFDPNADKELIAIDVAETYTVAADWTSVLQTVPKQDRASALTSKYEDLLLPKIA
jgi:hypothetical protein